jgi:hypothetical protein
MQSAVRDLPSAASPRLFFAMSQYIAPVVAVTLLIALSIIPQAIWTERFVPRETTAEQLALAERLTKLPTQFGDWVGEETPMGETERKAARIIGDYSYLFRNKLHPEQMVRVMLVCGHGMDLRKHTPDQCFIASGFAIADAERDYQVDISPTPAKFTTCRFRKDIAGQGPQNIRIFWSFNENDEWVAPTSPAALRTSPAIYKIYAQTFLANDAKELPNESAAIPFLREFLPAVSPILFPPKQPAEKPAEGAAATANPPTQETSPAVPTAAAN